MSGNAGTNLIIHVIALRVDHFRYAKLCNFHTASEAGTAVGMTQSIFYSGMLRDAIVGH